MLIELEFLLLSLLYELCQLVGGVVSILVCVVSNFYDPLHLPLLVVQIVRQLLVDLLKYFPLPSQLVDLRPQFIIGGNG